MMLLKQQYWRTEHQIVQDGLKDKLQVRVEIQSYMNWHVEVIRLERVSHVPKSLEGVAPAGLLKTKRYSRFTTFLRNIQKHSNRPSTP